MSYQVLARKWRPRLFSEMVGQEHVVRALINALDNDRLHHAFLFTGTRGVGKTTVARILAKSLNCEQGVSSTPCGECSTCREVDEGRFVDLIEVDAASRTKVEDTRELMDNVQYAPTRGRYKVYLIDEVHMLSTHSFNALLKTLEEPPPHVKFLLATTDPQKVPVTVLSRCLQFSLKRLPAELIQSHLQHIVQAEGVPFSDRALHRIALAADGSMRDALSLLDQAIAYGGGELREEEVRDMLGAIDQQFVANLLRHVIGGDGKSLLGEVARLAASTPDFTSVLGEMIALLQRIAMAQVIPEALDPNRDDVDLVRELAGLATPEDIQLYYQIALHGRRDLPLSPDPRGGFEMVLLRMLAFRPLGEEGESLPPPESRQAEPVQGRTSSPDRRDPAPEAAAPAKSNAPFSDATPAVEDTVVEPTADNWNSVVGQLGLGGMARELAMHCSWGGREGNRVTLILDREREQLLSGALEKRLGEALGNYLGSSIRLKIEVGAAPETPARARDRDQAARQAAAEAAVAADPNVRALQETFSATIREGSTRPIDDVG
ncbi:MAG: hypothetical protein Kow006_18880 [Gammaproteobacteria bacterium]